MNKTNKYKFRTKALLFKSFLLATLFFVISSCSNDETQTVVNFTELVMQDEFDTDGDLNSAIWDYEIGTGENGWGNNELQYYRIGTGKLNTNQNLFIEDGFLKIQPIYHKNKFVQTELCV